MTTDRLERRLAAVLVADLVGYSRLMSADEVGTLRDLERWRGEVRGLVEGGQGRLLDFSGDRFLAEFASVQRAADCALAIHRALAADGAGRPPERRLAFRMGLHVGDVLVDGDTIAGHGVNVAARLEPLAEPGGLCISEAAHQQLCDVPGLAFDDLGAHTLKNLPRPMRVYRVRAGAPAAGEPPAPPSPTACAVAVLPFDNVSGDPDQEYFADGMTEDLITELARLRGLVVIARHSCFVYKGKPTKVQDVGRDLGVSYVLEGSVRRAGSRVRINAQLIEAASGYHVWAERFDRELGDVFALQDDVVQAVASSVERTLGGVPARPADERAHATVNPLAYELYLRGRFAWNRRTTVDVRRAIELFEEAIRIDPGSAQFHAALAQAFTVSEENSVGSAREVARRALAVARRAVELDPDSADARTALGGCQAVMEWEFTAARANFERAIALSPSASLPHHWKAQIDMGVGRAEEALEGFARACQLDPLSPNAAVGFGFFGEFFAGNVERGRALLEEAVRLDESFMQAHACLGLLLAHAGDASGSLRHAERSRALADGAVLPQAALAYALGRAGRDAEADGLIEELERRSRSSYVTPALLAVAHAGRGRADRVLDWLERLVEVGAWTPFHLAAAPMWDAVRDSERFRAVAARMGVPQRLPGVPESLVGGGAEQGRERPAPADTLPVHGAFRKEGEFWTVEFAGRTARLGDSRGMGYLARLLERPFDEVRATWLETGDAGDAAGQIPGELATDAGDDAGELIDRRARDEYRRRAGELRAELEDAEACNDVGRAMRAREQLEMIEQELRRALGLGGRVRRAGSRAERARVNVTKAIRSAIGRIQVAHPALGAHLEAAVRTGTVCAYRPEPSRAPRWTVARDVSSR